jgi:hypothetical protein
MYSWATELKRMDRALNAGLFIGALMTAAVLRYSLENMRITTTEDEDIAKPKELLDLSNWEKFWEQWRSYVGRLRVAAKCPLSYVFREHQLVDAAMHIANYNDHDERLINTTVLAGPWFELDNQRVYEEFKALILKGPGWSFIKTYDAPKMVVAQYLPYAASVRGLPQFNLARHWPMPRSLQLVIVVRRGPSRSTTTSRPTRMHIILWRTSMNLFLRPRKSPTFWLGSQIHD